MGEGLEAVVQVGHYSPATMSLADANLTEEITMNVNPTFPQSSSLSTATAAGLATVTAIGLPTAVAFLFQA